MNGRLPRYEQAGTAAEEATTLMMAFTGLQLDSPRHLGFRQHAARWGTPTGAFGGYVCAIAMSMGEVSLRPALATVRDVIQRDQLVGGLISAEQEFDKADMLRYQRSRMRNGAGAVGGGRIH